MTMQTFKESDLIKFRDFDSNDIIVVDNSGSLTLGNTSAHKPYVTINTDVTASGNLSLSGGIIDLKNSGNTSKILFYCESNNAHAQTVQAAPHTDAASNTLVLPSTGTKFATQDGTEIFTNKTLTSPDINTPDIDGGTIDNTVIGNSTANAGTFTNLASTNITASGDISASGNIIGLNLSGTNTGDQDLSSYIQASQTSSFSTATGVEDNADVTDTSNVTAAGALMDSELAEIATVKALTAAGISGSFNAPSASFSTRVTANDAKISYTDAAVTSVINIAGVLSSSVQIASNISGAFVLPSSSFSTRITTLESAVDDTGTDSQTLSFNSVNNNLAISSGNSVDLSSLAGDGGGSGSSIWTTGSDFYFVNANLQVTGSFHATSLTGSIDYSNLENAPSSSFSTRVTTLETNNTGTNTGDQNILNLAITGSNVTFANITASGNISASNNLIGNSLVLSGGIFTSSSLAAAVGGSDNLGNHTATTDLNLSSNSIKNIANITASGNISASGDIIAPRFIASGSNTTSGFVFPNPLDLDDLTTNRITLTSARNMQFRAGGVLQFTKTSQILNGNDLTLKNTNNVDTISISNNAGAISSSRIDFFSSSATFMSITSSGKIGIGTTTPGEALEVVGNISASGTITANEYIGITTSSITNFPTEVSRSAAAAGFGEGGSGGTITALNNKGENRLVTIGSTTTELDGEANLTYVGTTLTNVGAISASAFSGDGSGLTGTSGNPFPFTGSATISGSLTVTGPINATQDFEIQGALTASAISTPDFNVAGGGVPTINSDSNLILSASNAVVVRHVLRLTPTTTGSITAQNGDIVYDSTDNKFYGYANGAWVAFH
jgi:hypothetical protein